MALHYPDKLYKYQTIDDFQNLETNRTLKNLFNRYAIFSSRKNFNDIFDLKIELLHPSVNDLQQLRKIVSNKYKKQVSSYIKDNWFSKEWKIFSSALANEFEEILDNYRIYCLSEDCKSNLLWGHYANSHKGFCIEFHSQYVKATPIDYQSEIASLDLIELLKNKLEVKNQQKELIEKVGKAFSTKLDYWSYEKEYRIIASNELEKKVIKEMDKISIFQYEEEWVSSIIFGCRMPDNVKRYIIDNIPYKVDFQEAKELKNHIEIYRI